MNLWLYLHTAIRIENHPPARPSNPPSHLLNYPSAIRGFSREGPRRDPRCLHDDESDKSERTSQPGVREMHLCRPPPWGRFPCARSRNPARPSFRKRLTAHGNKTRYRMAASSSVNSLEDCGVRIVRRSSGTIRTRDGTKRNTHTHTHTPYTGVYLSRKRSKS